MVKDAVQQMDPHSVKGVATSIGFAGASLLPFLTDIFQLLAAVIAVASGIMVLLVNWRKLFRKGDKNVADSENVQPGPTDSDSR